MLFSQFTHTLDLLDDYMRMKGYKFARLDGSTNRVQVTVLAPPTLLVSRTAARCKLPARTVSNLAKFVSQNKLGRWVV